MKNLAMLILRISQGNDTIVDRAVQILKDALALEPENEELWFSLGSTFWFAIVRVGQ